MSNDIREVSIVRARIEHLPAMKKLCRQLVDHLQSQGHDAPFIWESERIEDDMFGPHRCIEGFLAFSGEDAVGYTIIAMAYDIEYMRRDLLMLDLWVNPEFRGAGVAQLLVERNLAYAKHVGAGQFSAKIYKNNPSMERFAEKFGFELDDKTINIRMPIDAIEQRLAAPSRKVAA